MTRSVRKNLVNYSIILVLLRIKENKMIQLKYTESKFPNKEARAWCDLIKGNTRERISIGHPWWTTLNTFKVNGLFWSLSSPRHTERVICFYLSLSHTFIFYIILPLSPFHFIFSRPSLSLSLSLRSFGVCVHPLMTSNPIAWKPKRRRRRRGQG